MVVPDSMDALGHRRCPYLADYLVQTNRTHVVEIITSNNLRRQLDEFVFEPVRARAGEPYALHVVVDKFSDGWVPCL